ncbi:extracellular electron transfer flavoprotein PplA [Niallia sp. XMNu-256]|uniref:extracellular electron transfer flavoprotein PplA n=1 Tax=Niallia sp. XMNu-256 TaxID=3082444 RepID=UPI0030CD02B2
MKIGKKTFVTSMAVSLALILGACGNNEAADAPKEETPTETATENTETTENEQATETAAPKKLAGAELQDGTYTLEEKEISDKGWKATFSIKVEDGKITESNYNYVNADGKLKTDDEEYQKSMSEKTGVGPQDYIPTLNDDLIAKQDAQQVEVVTGATHSAESFKNYAQQLIQAAQAGNTETIVIDAAAPLQDGEYSLEEKNLGATGWRTVFKMTVKDGKIVTSDYNNVNAENQLKTDDDEYQKNMSEKAGTGPQEFIPALNDDLVAKQAAGDIEVVTGATGTSNGFILYAQQLINAAQKGDTNPIVIDNIVFEKK